MLDEIRAIEKGLGTTAFIKIWTGNGREAFLAEPLGFIFTFIIYFFCIGNKTGVRRDSWRGLADQMFADWISSHPEGCYCGMNRLCSNPVC